MPIATAEREGTVLTLQSSDSRRRRIGALVLVLALVACSDTDPTAPTVPIPTAPSELAGAWSFADSSVYATAVEQTTCRNRGIVRFTPGMTSTGVEVRSVGTCISPRGSQATGSVGEGEQVTVTADSIAFTVTSGSGINRESCRYLGRLTSVSTLGASGTVSCSRGRTGQWQMSWGLPRATRMGKLTAVDIGLGYTCALEVSGQAWCWGANIGQLGTGDDLPRLVPAPVTGAVRFTKIAVSPEGAFVCGLTAEGKAYCWGSSWGGRLGDGSGAESGKAVMAPQPVTGGHAFKDIALGGDHACAITTAGAAYCWGYNWAGHLGTGNDIPSTTPVAVTGGLTFLQIDAYTGNTCGVTTTGRAYCWGEGWSGVLGNGETKNSHVPVPVSGGLTFASVSVGGWMACGVTTDGDGYCWGTGGPGLGTGSAEDVRTTPGLVAGGMKWKSITAGTFVACGVTITNAGYCWGDNFQGTLGAGASMKAGSNRPIAIAGSLTFAQVVVDWHGCAVTVAGIAYCWSAGSSGEIGDGDLRLRYEPVRVAGQS